MVVFITGGNDNGKSEYAEDLVMKLSPGGRSAGYIRIYLATMGARDEESLKRINKHVYRRKDMEYITIEKSFDIGSVKIDIDNIGIDDLDVNNTAINNIDTNNTDTNNTDTNDIDTNDIDTSNIGIGNKDTNNPDIFSIDNTDTDNKVIENIDTEHIDNDHLDTNGSAIISSNPKKIKRILLIEDIPNLLAGEMFQGTSFNPDVSDKIVADITKLISACENTVIVTNEVFSDGIVYDEYTTTYLREFGIINRKLAMASDKVVELVCGIPLIIKDKNS